MVAEGVVLVDAMLVDGCKRFSFGDVRVLMIDGENFVSFTPPLG